MSSTITAQEIVSDAAAVTAAVAALGPLDREALLLRLGDRGLDEVARITGTTPAMVRVRLHRAATAVERRVGQLPLDGTDVQPDRARPTDEVVVDAEVGITPMLHARLVAALADAGDARGPRFRRLAALVQRVAGQTPQLGSCVSLVGLVATGIAALSGAV